MSSWHSYPSIYNVGHKAVENFFDEPVIIQEKVDGSQFSFGVFDGVLKAKSHHKEIVIDAPDKMWIPAIETIKSIKDKLIDGYTYRGEYLAKPKHNTLKYDRVPSGNIVIFDINDDEESYKLPFDVYMISKEINLEIVPTYDNVKIETVEQMKSYLERESFLGGTKIEGVVFKNYSKFGVDKKVLMAKYVSESFKEIHNAEWEKSNPTGKDIVRQIIDELKTDARWEKAISHLKEKGELENDPRDIGKLLKEINVDILKECTEYIKDRLFKENKDHILRGCISGFPEWYKDRLAKNQFEKVEK
jgi:hypothetical protein